MAKAGRNDPCPCGSGKKYKSCCASKERPLAKKQFKATLISGGSKDLIERTFGAFMSAPKETFFPKPPVKPEIPETPGTTETEK